MPETFNPPPPPNPQPAVKYSRPVATGDTVVVACKLPSGIILRVFDWRKYQEPSRDGSIHESQRAVPIAGRQFVIKGPWIATAGQAYNSNNGAVGDLLPGGYAITEGCPREIWDGWYEQNKHSKLVESHVIMAHKDRNALIDEVRKHTSIISGLEPLDRANPGARMGGVDRRLRLGILETGGGGP
jgi:hypothetical protein